MHQKLLFNGVVIFRAQHYEVFIDNIIFIILFEDTEASTLTHLDLLTAHNFRKDRVVDMWGPWEVSVLLP